MQGLQSIYPNHTSCNITACNFTMPSGSVFELSNLMADANGGTGFQYMATKRQHSVKVWWGDSLTLLLFRIDNDITQAARDAKPKGDLDKSVHDIRVSLGKEPGNRPWTVLSS